MLIFKFVVVGMLGYMIGSIPWGLLISKWLARIDIRNYGSGRTGGTNVLRTLGRKAFILVVLLDIGKGAAAVFFGYIIIGNDIITIGNSGLGAIFGQVIGGMAAVAGHIWPIYANFKGGRGVATFFGALIAMCPIAGLSGGAIFIVTALLSGYASLGSITGIIATYVILIPLTLLYGYPFEYLIFALLGSVIVTIVHKDNIKRLIRGNERRLNARVDLDNKTQAQTNKKDNA